MDGARGRVRGGVGGNDERVELGDQGDCTVEAGAESELQARTREGLDLDARRARGEELGDAGGRVRLLVAQLGVCPEVVDESHHVVVRGQQRSAHPGCGSVAAAQRRATLSRSPSFWPIASPAATTTANTMSRLIAASRDQTRPRRPLTRR